MHCSHQYGQSHARVVNLTQHCSRDTSSAFSRRWDVLLRRLQRHARRCTFARSIHPACSWRSMAAAVTDVERSPLSVCSQSVGLRSAGDVGGTATIYPRDVLQTFSRAIIDTAVQLRMPRNRTSSRTCPSTRWSRYRPISTGVVGGRLTVEICRANLLSIAERTLVAGDVLISAVG